MLRMNLLMSDCRGQCYNGAANMHGSKHGVAIQFRSESIGVGAGEAMVSPIMETCHTLFWSPHPTQHICDTDHCTRKSEVVDCCLFVTFFNDYKTLGSPELIQTKLHLWPHPSIISPQFLGASYATGEPCTTFIHCYGHAQNLATLVLERQWKKECYLRSQSLQISLHVEMLFFEQLKTKIYSESLVFMTRCPTRWTMRVSWWCSVSWQVAVTYLTQICWWNVNNSLSYCSYNDISNSRHNWVAIPCSAQVDRITDTVVCVSG